MKGGRTVDVSSHPSGFTPGVSRKPKGQTDRTRPPQSPTHGDLVLNEGVFGNER